MGYGGQRVLPVPHWSLIETYSFSTLCLPITVQATIVATKATNTVTNVTDLRFKQNKLPEHFDNVSLRYYANLQIYVNLYDAVTKNSRFDTKLL